jgi:hypothetical protein
LTITLNEQALVFPEPSVAVQLTLFVPRAKVEPDTGAQLTVRVAQLSVAVAAKVTLLRVHWSRSFVVTMFAGQVIAGGSASLTVTAKEQLALLPDPSVAVQLTVLVPLAKIAPEAGAQLIVAAPQLSVAVAA